MIELEHLSVDGGGHLTAQVAADVEVVNGTLPDDVLIRNVRAARAAGTSSQASRAVAINTARWSLIGVLLTA